MIESRHLGVCLLGIKYPPIEVYKKSIPPGLFRLPTLYVASLRTPSTVWTSSTMNFYIHPPGHPKGPQGPTVSRPSTATDNPRSSFGLHQHSSFPDNEISTVTRLLPSFYDGRPPFGSRSDSCESRTSTTSGLLRTPTVGCLSQTSTVSKF